MMGARRCRLGSKDLPSNPADGNERMTMSTESESRRDERILERVRDRDRDAFEELYRIYAPRLFGYLLRVTRRPEVVEETVDEVLLAVWRGADRFEGRSRPSTWIFGIAYRKAMRALRRRRRRPETEPLPRDLHSETEDPEHKTIRRERAERLSALLAELSPEQRAVLELTY